MNEIRPIDPAKFQDPDITADGSERASVSLTRLETLWLNTGTLCNLECASCYIESSPTNDRLVYLSLSEANRFFDEIDALNLGTHEIGITGGEPFMNPEIIPIMESALERGFDVLVLTNAMKPMAHKKAELLKLKERSGHRLQLRVSVDHYSRERHEEERGPNSFAPMLEGLKWLSDNGFDIAAAGRTFSSESEEALRAGYGRLFAEHGIELDASDPAQLILFPEMDENKDVPEITTECWGLLNVRPEDQMCASSRMVIHRKGEPHAKVVPCTLLPYDPQFEMGTSLAEALGQVKLNHPHCAKFCVLGGGSCSA
ncbi:MAG: radical SAM protein [Alphaproteobacteria bacterium]|nr:radical SAM protein [Alphaproteobacteria bacterium]